LDLNGLKDLKDLNDFTGEIVPRRSVDFARGEEREVPETPRLKPVRLGGVMEGGGMEGQGEGEKLWWSEAEITGHDPQDPADDGEGINGVGFLPVSSCRFYTSFLACCVGFASGDRKRGVLAVAFRFRGRIDGLLISRCWFGIDPCDCACARGEAEEAGQGLEGEGGEGGEAEEE